MRPGPLHFDRHRAGRKTEEGHRRAATSRCAALLLTCVVVAAAGGGAFAEDTVKKTDDLLSSVAGIARDLELADVPSPIDVTADRLEFDYKNGVLTYTGNVRIEHAGATMRAQHVEISFTPEPHRKLEKIVARGGVEVIRGKDTARGEAAEYDPAAGTIVLSQNARLGSGPNSLSGERVVIYLREKRAVVQGGGTAGQQASTSESQGTGTSKGRVRVVIMPDSVKSESDRPGATEDGKQ